jgi:copper chaperone NosL
LESKGDKANRKYLGKEIVGMIKESLNNIYYKRFFTVTVFLILVMAVGCAKSGKKTSQVTVPQPMVIAQDVSCGKCGMYPAKYPQWQSQIIFKDGAMTPFDGCKCMFNFMSSMDKYDKTHSKDDVAVVWVKDYSNSKWIDGTKAHFVVGSKVMGPMGKELIPFADQAAAMKFHQEQGGNMMMYGEITPEVLKSLMGDMKKHGQGSESGHMKM